MGEIYWKCRSRRDGYAPVAAHAFAARRWPSAGSGRGGRSRRARGTGRADGYAPVAAQASAARRWPSTREGGRVTAEARGACEARIRSPLEPAPACRGSRGGTLGGHNVHEIPRAQCARNPILLPDTSRARQNSARPVAGRLPQGGDWWEGVPRAGRPWREGGSGEGGGSSPPPQPDPGPGPNPATPHLVPLVGAQRMGGGCPAPSVTARGGRRAGRSPPPPRPHPGLGPGLESRGGTAGGGSSGGWFTTRQGGGAFAARILLARGARLAGPARRGGGAAGGKGPPPLPPAVPLGCQSWPPRGAGA